MDARPPFLRRHVGQDAVAVRVRPEVEGVVGGHEELVGALHVAVEQQHVADSVGHLVVRVAEFREQGEPVGRVELGFREELRAPLGGDAGALVREVHAAQRTARVAARRPAVRVGEARRVETVHLERRERAVGVRHGAAQAAGRAAPRVEGPFDDVPVAVGVDGAGDQPVEVGAEVLVLPVTGAVDVDMAAGNGEPGGETQVVRPVAGVPVAGGHLEALETRARHHVGDAGHRLGPVRGRGPVAEDLDPLDHREGQRVDVEKAVAHVVGHGGDAGAPAVDEGQGRGQAESAQAELRRALEIALFGGERRAGVGREVLQHVHGLRRPGGLEELRVEGLHGRPAVVDRAPLDERADDHDLLDDALAVVPVRGFRRRGRGADGGEDRKQAMGASAAT